MRRSSCVLPRHRRLDDRRQGAADRREGHGRGLRHDAAHAPDAEAALVRAGPARVVEGHGRQHPQGARRGRGDRRRRGRGRPHRPDARPRAARRASARCCAPPSCGTTSAPAPSATRSSGASAGAELIREVGQRRAHRLHRAQDPLGPQPRARGLREGEARAAAEGLRAPAPHRRGGDGQGRRLGHDPVRPQGARLVEARPREARDPGRVAAADVRGPGDDRARSRPRPRPRRASQAGHAGDGRRRRPGRGRRGRGRRAARRRLADARHLGRRLRHDRRAARRARGPAPRLLPRRARHAGTSWA